MTSNSAHASLQCGIYYFLLNFLYSQFILCSPINHFWIEENLEKGNIIGKLLDPDLQAVKQCCTFTSLAQWPISQIFRINTTDGSIYTTQKIDREKMCPTTSYDNRENEDKILPSTSSQGDGDICQIDFQVHVSAVNHDGSPKSRLLGVKIFITDMNDNIPTFGLRQYVLQILESSPVDSEFRLPQAVDSDSGTHGVVDYIMKALGKSPNASADCDAHIRTESHLSIGSDPDRSVNHYFTLKTLRERANTLQPVLKQINSLDREIVDSLYFCLVALDGGSHRGSLPVKIEILDINDNVPNWIGLPYKVTLPECEGTYSPKPLFPSYSHSLSHIIGNSGLRFVCVLRTEDQDIGSNGKVTYRLSKQPTGSKWENLPAVVIRENKVFLSSKLDYESMKKFWIPVEAVDGGGLSNFTEIEVTVEDCNDHPPTISIIPINVGGSDGQESDLGRFNLGLAKSKILWVEEEVDKRIDIATIVVNDLDESDSNHVNCRLECQNNHVSGINPFAIESTLESDKEGRETSRTQPSLFLLYKRPGMTLDRELTPVFILEIICTDNNINKPLETKELVHVKVEDRNDNPPSFSTTPSEANKTYPIQTIHMPENQPPKTLIGSVLAEDADEGINARLIYEFLDPARIQVRERPDASGETIFDMNRTTGQMYTKISFDREQNSSFNVYVRVRDHGIPPLSSTVIIHIIITDVNDCAPVFRITDPDRGRIVFSVNESNGKNHVYGRLVGELHAEDADQGPFKTIHYEYVEDSLVPKDVKVKYRVMPQGKIYADGQLDREQYEVHEFSVRAIDGGPIGQRLSSTATVVVRLLDVNDNPPSFLKPTGSASSFSPNIPSDTINVTVDMPPGSILYRIVAMDADSAENTQMHFTIRSAKFLTEYFELRPVDVGHSGSQSTYPISKTEVILLKSLSYLFPVGYFAFKNSTTVRPSSPQATEYFLYIIVNDSMKEPSHSSTARLKLRVLFDAPVRSNKLPKFTAQNLNFTETQSSSSRVRKQGDVFTDDRDLFEIDGTTQSSSASLSVIFIMAIVMICIFLGVFCFVAFLYLRRLSASSGRNGRTVEIDQRDKKTAALMGTAAATTQPLPLSAVSGMDTSNYEHGICWDSPELNGTSETSSLRQKYSTLDKQSVTHASPIGLTTLALNDKRFASGQHTCGKNNCHLWSCIEHPGDEHTHLNLVPLAELTGQQKTMQLRLTNAALSGPYFKTTNSEVVRPKEDYQCTWGSPRILLTNPLESHAPVNHMPCQFACDHSSSSNVSTFGVSNEQQCHATEGKKRVVEFVEPCVGRTLEEQDRVRDTFNHPNLEGQTMK